MTHLPDAAAAAAYIINIATTHLPDATTATCLSEILTKIILTRKMHHMPVMRVMGECASQSVDNCTNAHDRSDTMIITSWYGEMIIIW